MIEAITSGVHHIGLTVDRIEESAAFFTRLLGWREVRRDPDYPAIFVSDGTVLVTLWGVKDKEARLPFDQRRNVGLHHVAFEVMTRDALDEVHARVRGSELEVEFAPELLRGGPAMHMICYEPSGIRVEFIWPGT